MSAKSRNKGASFEREIAAELHGLTGIQFARNLEQVRAADHGDLTPDDPAFPFLIECKRYASGVSCLAAWRKQATTAAQRIHKIPAVVFRFDRQTTRVAVPMDAIFAAHGGTPMQTTEWCEISLNGLAYLAAEIMAGAK